MQGQGDQLAVVLTEDIKFSSAPGTWGRKRTWRR